MRARIRTENSRKIQSFFRAPAPEFRAPNDDGGGPDLLRRGRQALAAKGRADPGAGSPTHRALQAGDDCRCRLCRPVSPAEPSRFCGAAECRRARSGDDRVARLRPSGDRECRSKLRRALRRAGPHPVGTDRQQGRSRDARTTARSRASGWRWRTRAAGRESGDEPPEARRDDRLCLLGVGAARGGRDGEGHHRREGVNLQKASTIIFSDLPYTPKLVEQRIGRIDRMNSNHKEVNVVWVKYPDCLLLPNDVEFKKRYNTISEILGSNYELPDFFNEYSKKKIKDVAQLSSEIIEETNKEIIKDKEKEELTSDSEIFGFNDAFGDYEKLIKFTNPEFYLNKNKYLHKIMKENGSIYSFVEGDSNWGLLYLFDKKNGYPILLFVDIDEEKVYDNLIDLTPKIVSKFKNIKKTIKKEMDEEFLNNKIKYCLEQARKPEIKAPSGEQKKSLWLLESFLKEYAPVDLKYKALYDKLNKILNKKELAKKWHSIIKDVYIEYLKNEIDNRSLPSIINIKDSLKYQGYFEYNLIENLLEESIEDKIDYSIRVCLMSFKNNN